MGKGKRKTNVYNMKKITIAIDGYSSTGKSTIAKQLANALGYVYIDSGAMYRAVALYALQHKLIQNSVLNTEELINTYSYSSYELVSENLSQVKGKINFNQYISNIASGNWHQIPCEFDEFRFDNQLNRIIKYV